MNETENSDEQNVLYIRKPAIKRKIDWDIVAALPSEKRLEFFKNFVETVLNEPLVSPTIVWLDYISYRVNEENAEILLKAYKEYSKLDGELCELRTRTPLFDIDFEALQVLPPDVRLKFCDKTIESIRSRSIIDPLVIKNEYGYSVINKSDEETYTRCLNERAKAKEALKTDDPRQKRPKKVKRVKNKTGLSSKLAEKKDSFFKSLSEKKARKYEQDLKKKKARILKRAAQQEAKRKKKETQKKNNKLSPIQLVALGLVAVSAISTVSVFALLPFIKKSDKKDKEDDRQIEVQNPEQNPIIDDKFTYEEPEPAPEIDERTEKEKLYDDCITEYAIYFNVDTKLAVELARNLTHDYTESFLQVFQNALYDYEDEETTSMIFVYLLSKNELPLVSNHEDWISGEIRTTDPTRELILRTGESFSRYIGRLSKLLGIDENYALAICYTIVGLDKDLNVHDTNNFGAHKKDGEYIVYPSAEAGIVSYLIELKKLEEKNITTLEELSGLITHDDRDEPNEDWLQSVKMFHKIISETPEDYFSVDNENEVDKTLVFVNAEKQNR